MEIKEKKVLTAEMKGLKEVHDLCFRKNIPFVSFRSPGNSNVRTLIQTGSYPRKLSSLKNIHENRGFILSPFRKSFENSAYILEPDIEIDNDQVDDSLLKHLAENKNFSNVNDLNGKDLVSVSKEKFMDQVKMIQDEIRRGKIKKAVLSRVYFEKKTETFDVSRFFNELTLKYPDAFVYLFRIPEAGCWIGATPEPLILIKNNIFETISLAGTQKTCKSGIDKVHWSTKELEEQDIVTRYIEEILADFNINQFNKIGPFTFQAGNVMHLKTRFLFDALRIGPHAGEFAEALHPTPSVCGLPKDEAFELIEKTEIHHREYYTGILGPVNIDDETSLYVNLRCMKLLEDKMALFLGAGITSASVPENEWQETNQKKMTLMAVIEKLNK